MSQDLNDWDTLTVNEQRFGSMLMYTFSFLDFSFFVNFAFVRDAMQCSGHPPVLLPVLLQVLLDRIACLAAARCKSLVLEPLALPAITVRREASARAAFLFGLFHPFGLR